MNRPLFTWTLALVATLAGSLRAPADAEAVEVSRGPLVQLVTRHSAVLVWRSVGPTIPLVRYGAAPDALDSLVLPVQMTIRVAPGLVAPPDLPRLHSAPAETYQYEAHLTGLTEDTVYYYGIFDGGDLLAGGEEDYHFRTQAGPGADRPLRFWVVGDSGDGSANQIAAFNAMRQFVADEGRSPDAFIHLGDMAYNSGKDSEFQANFFDIYRSLLRNTVTWPTMGNHEGRTSNGPLAIGPYYDAYVLPRAGEAGGVPSGSEAFYSFDFGPIHFVCLNSHDEQRSEAGRMATWLLEDLAQNNSEWLIAFWHHPPYSQGTHLSDLEGQLIEMREVMMPILEAHGVDFVLAGHSHTYERSMLIDGAYATPTTSEGVVLDDGDGHPAGDGAYWKSAHNHPHEGSVAVVGGHGRSARRQGFFPLHRKSITEVGSVLLDLEGDTMTVRMLNLVGVVRDEFQVVKRGEVGPRVALADPWDPYGPAIVMAEREPGKTELHLFAQPQADDAVLRFTLDGSTPTAASPVYAGPIHLAQPTTVRALSTWRGGQRTSPVAKQDIIQPASGVVRTIRIPILASDDDASESDLGLVDLTGRTIGIDSTQAMQSFGLRFRGIPIPKDATVVASFIEFAPAALRIDPAAWTIHADLGAPSAPFTTAIGNLSSRARSDLSVAWSLPRWQGLYTLNQSTPDLSGIVEEVVHHQDWSKGDPLTFLLSGTGDRVARSFDMTPRLAPRLHVSFDPRDAVTLAADVHPAAEVGVAWDGSRQVYVSFYVLASATRRGLEYVIEGSPTLAPGSWETLAAAVDRFFLSPGPGWYNLRWRVARPGGAEIGESYFIRVRVTSP